MVGWVRKGGSHHLGQENAGRIYPEVASFGSRKFRSHLFGSRKCQENFLCKVDSVGNPLCKEEEFCARHVYFTELLVSVIFVACQCDFQCIKFNFLHC